MCVNTEPVIPQWQPRRLITHCGRCQGNKWGAGSDGFFSDWGPLERMVKGNFFVEAFGWNPEHPFITND